ncbi:tetratricopeptide repeat protein [Zavarzinella formosa]|uniref:tetratricopeptide repeat protein n=1 Tax=Zavarzinella formosa TaxID=360055 RepID=UPI0002FE619C|nr:hypothetical protein [Zavarzinella formosa]
MPSPDEFVHAALECFHEDDFPETIRVCHRGLDQHPDTGRLWEILGLAHWMRGEIQAALSPLETASLYVPLQPLAQLALAAAYAWANKPDLARTVYKHLADCPGFPVPLMPRLAAGLGRIGENEAALLVCEKLVELRPDYHPAWFGIAFYRRRLGRPVHEATDPLT